MQLKFVHSIVVLFSFFLMACGGTAIPPNPVNDMKKEFASKYAYTIILYDMDLDKGQYKHRYKVFDIAEDNSVKMEITDWKDVDDDFFALHEANLGMEVLSKYPDGRLNNLATAPGFTHFVGNTTYGKWNEPETYVLPPEQVYWEFSSDYPDLMNHLELQSVKVSKKEYDDFVLTYQYNRPFYGQKYHEDSTKYGTYSRHWIFIRPGFYNRRRSQDYFNKTGSGGNSGGFRGGGGFGK